ncbi:hypothetical protein GCM10022323_19660 [Asaccharospora irregularis DSM 2635]
MSIESYNLVTYFKNKPNIYIQINKSFSKLYFKKVNRLIFLEVKNRII